MPKPLCRFASPLREGKRRLRICSFPQVGGEVESGKECQQCQFHERRPPGPRPVKAPEPLLQLTLNKVLPQIKIKQVPKLQARCIHRSEKPVDKIQCDTCKGNVSLLVYSCAGGFGTCLLQNKVDGRGCCSGCTKYTNGEADAAPKSTTETSSSSSSGGIPPGPSDEGR